MKVVLLVETQRRFEAEDRYFHDRERDIVEIHSIWGAPKTRTQTVATLNLDHLKET